MCSDIEESHDSSHADFSSWTESSDGNRWISSAFPSSVKMSLFCEFSITVVLCFHFLQSWPGWNNTKVRSLMHLIRFPCWLNSVIRTTFPLLSVVHLWPSHSWSLPCGDSVRDLFEIPQNCEPHTDWWPWEVRLSQDLRDERLHLWTSLLGSSSGPEN